MIFLIFFLTCTIKSMGLFSLWMKTQRCFPGRHFGKNKRMKILQILQPKAIDPSPQGRVSFTSGIATHTSAQPRHAQGWSQQEKWNRILCVGFWEWPEPGLCREHAREPPATNPAAFLLPHDQQDPGAGRWSHPVGWEISKTLWKKQFSCSWVAPGDWCVFLQTLPVCQPPLHLFNSFVGLLAAFPALRNVLLQEQHPLLNPWWKCFF